MYHISHKNQSKKSTVVCPCQSTSDFERISGVHSQCTTMKFTQRIALYWLCNQRKRKQGSVNTQRIKQSFRHVEQILTKVRQYSVSIFTQK